MPSTFQANRPVAYFVKCWLHSDAEAELGEAAEHYARQASPVIAEAFLAEFERVVGLLVENQYRCPHGDADLRVFHCIDPAEAQRRDSARSRFRPASFGHAVIAIHSRAEDHR